MIKALVVALSFGTFLSMLNGQDLPMEDAFYEGAEPNRIQKRSTFDLTKVSIWLENAKSNNDDAIKTLDKIQPQAQFRTKLNSANEELERVQSEFSEARLIELTRNALRLEADALRDMLSAYKTIGEELRRNKLLNVIYLTTGAVCDLVTALAEGLTDVFQKPDISIKAEKLRKQIFSALPGDINLPETAVQLAEKALKRTEIR